MKYSLRMKLSAAFLLVSLFWVICISIFANFFLEDQFTAYVIKKQEQEISASVVSVSNQYNVSNEAWSVSGVENVGMSMLGEGLIVRVKDVSDTVIWDAREHNNGMCISILENLAQNMQTYDPNFKGGYEEQTYPVTVDGTQVGSIDVGYYGPYAYSDLDMQFLQSLNHLLWIAAAVSFLVCLTLGAYMARRLTRPISRVIHTTGMIAEGDFNDRIKERSSTKEILELTNSVNSLAQTLNEQENLRKRLTADVAHELRTPLATLQSHMEALIDGVWEPDQNRLESCHEEILRLSKLVGELEMLSRVEGDNLILHKSRMELSALIRRIILNFENDFKMKDVTLQYEEKVLWILADADKISQVIINLLSNALKYTPEGGKVEISTEKLTDSVIIRIQDSGTGISSIDLPHIFDRFYRTDESRNRATGGSGIGLTIAKSIVEAHEGKITAESEPDKGSTFTIVLPQQF